MYVLQLYITGHTPSSEKMLRELKEMFDRNCGGKYTLEVFDVFEHPEEAYENMIMATPTLVKILPAPARKIVGDLSNHERVLAGINTVTRGILEEAEIL